MKNWIIRFFGLKGSWGWAKKQMIKGRVVRCEHWHGTLKLKVDCPDNKLLQACYHRENKVPHNNSPFRLWETSNHHLDYEDYTDWVIVDGW